MLPSHLSRMLNECLRGDYNDPTVRERIQSRCIPYLSRHRREVLAGSFEGRHHRPAGYVRQVIGKASLIRKVLNHAHQQLNLAGVQSNVVSFRDALARGRQLLAS